MQNKYKEHSLDFTKFYSFIDTYISEHINSIILEDEWTWLLISRINCINNFDLKLTYNKFKFNKNNNINIDTKIKLISNLIKK